MYVLITSTRDCINDDSRFQSIFTALKTWLYVMIPCCYDKILVNLFFWSLTTMRRILKKNLQGKVGLCWCFMNKSNTDLWGGIKVYIYFDDDATMLEIGRRKFVLSLAVRKPRKCVYETRKKFPSTNLGILIWLSVQTWVAGEF